METRFKKSMVLNDVIDELRYNQYTEIIRIMDSGNSYVFEYNVEKKEKAEEDLK